MISIKSDLLFVLIKFNAIVLHSIEALFRTSWLFRQVACDDLADVGGDRRRLLSITSKCQRPLS